MKILLIGYGSIGKRHEGILSTFSNVKSIDIVTKQKIPNRTTFKSLNEIKKLSNYDYFIIANETYKHFSTMEFIDKLVKNKLILVEKPLFKNHTKYTPLNKILVAYNLRFHPIIEFLKQHKFIYINAFVGQDLKTWRKTKYTNNYSCKKKYGGGVLRDLSHEIDYIQYLSGKIKTIKAIVDKQSDLKINTEDIVVAIGNTKNSIINISMDYISKVSFRQIIAHTKNETFVCDFINNTINGKKLSQLDSNYTYRKMHQDILNMNFNKICSYKEGMQTMKIIKDIESV